MNSGMGLLAESVDKSLRDDRGLFNNPGAALPASWESPRECWLEPVAGPHPELPDSVDLGAPKCTFLTSSWVMSMLLVQEPHLENWWFNTMTKKEAQQWSFRQWILCRELGCEVCKGMP